jgi:antitoxin component YwqK of YwqJK toxin-antitoxin module
MFKLAFFYPILPGFFLLVSLALSAQKNQIDSQGRKQGEWVKYRDGVKIYEGAFIDDKPTGEFKRYFKSGRISSRSVFSNNGTQSYTEFYYDKRKNPIKARGNYYQQEKDSIWLYYNENGVVVKEEFFSNGLQNGVWKLYNYLGSLIKETPYKDGLIEGTQKEYFEEGGVKRLMSFVADSLQGVFSVYYPNEVLRIKGFFERGLQDKEWYYYKPDGSVEFIEYYRLGLLTKRTDENGNSYRLKTDTTTAPLDKTIDEIIELK